MRNYGDVVGVWIKSDFHVLISDPKSVEVSIQNVVEKKSSKRNNINREDLVYVSIETNYELGTFYINLQFSHCS